MCSLNIEQLPPPRLDSHWLCWTATLFFCGHLSHNQPALKNLASFNIALLNFQHLQPCVTVLVNIKKPAHGNLRLEQETDKEMSCNKENVEHSLTPKICNRGDGYATIVYPEMWVGIWPSAPFNPGLNEIESSYKGACHNAASFTKSTSSSSLPVFSLVLLEGGRYFPSKGTTVAWNTSCASTMAALTSYKFISVTTPALRKKILVQRWHSDFINIKPWALCWMQFWTWILNRCTIFDC